MKLTMRSKTTKNSLIKKSFVTFDLLRGLRVKTEQQPDA